MADRIQQRRDMKARWEQYNPILLEGEIGYVLDDPNLYKIGDGVKAWNSLPYRGYNGTLVSEAGNAENVVMSQKAVTDELALKAAHGYIGAEPQKTLKQVDDEVIQLAGDVSDSTEKAGAASLSELNARLLALEKIVSATITNKLEVTKEFNVWGKTNLILIGSGAASFAPDFIGQKYIDTAGGKVYVAVGVDTAGNWKLV